MGWDFGVTLLTFLKTQGQIQFAAILGQQISSPLTLVSLTRMNSLFAFWHTELNSFSIALLGETAI